MDNEDRFDAPTTKESIVEWICGCAFIILLIVFMVIYAMELFARIDE